MTAYASADEIIDAIRRANLVYPEPTFTPEVNSAPHALDGTYRIIPTWVGSARVFMAERIQETKGYEVAYQAALGGTDLNVIEEGDRWGYWEDGGIVFLDRTVHVIAPGGVALDLARLYAQEAIYSWETSECISTKDPATAI